MIIRFIPDAKETIRACGALAVDLQRPARAQMIFIGVFGTIFVAARLLTPAQWPIVVLLSIGSTVLAFAGIQTEYRHRTVKLLSDNPHLAETHEIEITAERLRTECSHSRTEYSWTGVRRVTENQEFYLFSTGPAAGVAVPKRALSDDDDRALREIVCAASPDRGANLAREVAIVARVT